MPQELEKCRYLFTVFIYRILKQMTGFRLLLFVPSPVLFVPPLECSYSGCVFVPDLVELSQM